MFDPTGFGSMSLKTSVGIPDCVLAATAARIKGILARAGSVTSSGRLMPSDRQASASSEILPAPKRIAVGKFQFIAGNVIAASSSESISGG